MKVQNYAGIDLSKLTFTICICLHDQLDDRLESEFANDQSGFKQLKDWMETYGLEFDQTLFCLEHTGLYGRQLGLFLWQNGGLVWYENPVAIIRSSGIQRGKNDQVDARRISTYAFKNTDRFRKWEPKRACVQNLHELLATRDQLIKCLNQLTVPIGELEQTGNVKLAGQIRKACTKSIKSLTREIGDIDQQISSTVYGDERLYELHTLAQSVPGIGNLTALWMICYTNEFKDFGNAKQLACYCGIAPFEYTSGTSVRGKSRVHHMANTKLKTMLHMGALAVIRGKSEMAIYYKRKVNDGKEKMNVINAVRNKLIHRLIAVIQRGTPYQNKYESVTLNL